MKMPGDIYANTPDKLAQNQRLQYCQPMIKKGCLVERLDSPKIWAKAQYRERQKNWRESSRQFWFPIGCVVRTQIATLFFSHRRLEHQSVNR
jgi:hypothetical protein